MYKKIAPLLVLCSFELFAAPLRIAPQAKDDTASVIVGVNPSVTLNPTANDRYGSIVTINGSTSGQYGYLSSTGTTYTLYDNDANAALAAGQIVTDTFTYTLANDIGQTATALIIISVRGNQKKTPVAVDDYASMVIGVTQTANGSLATNDRNGSIVTISGSTAGIYGSLTLTDTKGGYTYTLYKNIIDIVKGKTPPYTDTFTYTYANALGESSSASLRVTVTDGKQNTPVAVDDYYSATVGGSSTISIGANDRNGTVISLNAPAIGKYGYLQIKGTSPTDTVVTYATYDNNVSLPADATDTFTYTLSNDIGQSDIGHIYIRVQATNMPVAVPDTASLVVGIATNLTAVGSVITNDRNGTIVSFDGFIPQGSAVPNGSSSGIYGYLTMTSAGAYTYTLYDSVADIIKAGTPPFIDTFAYTLANALGQKDPNGRITVNVSTVQKQKPVAIDDYASVVVGTNTSAKGDLSSNDRYGSIVTLNGSPAGKYGYLTLTGTSGAYVYKFYDNIDNTVIADLAAGKPIADTFTYTYANDIGQTASASLSIQVTNNQQSPIAANDFVTLVPNTFTKVLSVPGNVSTNDKNGTSFYLESSPTATPNVCSPTNPPYPATSTPPCNTKNSPAGVYGNLVLDPDGKFVYTLNKDAPNVLALTAGLVVTDIFSYITTNAYGQIAIAKLNVKIIGNPVDANGNTIFVPPVDVPLDNVDVEFNNRSAQATPLNSGRNIKGSLYDGEDKDWYHLQSTGNEIINLDLCPKGSSCFGKKSWVVYVFDSAKLTVDKEEDSYVFKRWVTETGNYNDLQRTDILSKDNIVRSSNHLYLAYRLGFFDSALIGVIDPCFGEDSTLSIGVGKPDDPRDYFIAVSSTLMGTPAGQCGAGDIVLQKPGRNAAGTDADGKAKSYATTEEYITVFPYRDDQYTINITGTGIDPLCTQTKCPTVLPVTAAATFSATTGVLNIPQVMISNAPYSVSLTLQNQPVTLNAPIANSTASASSPLKYTLSGIQGLDPTTLATAFHATYNPANQQLLIPRVTDTVSGKAYSVAMQYHPAVGSNPPWLDLIDYLLIQ